MELAYRQYHLLNVVDRFRPIACTLVPLSVCLRVSYIVSNLLMNPNFSVLGISTSVVRLSISCSMIYSCTIVEWSDKFKLKIGSCFVWFYRIYLVMMIAQEAGLEQDQSQIMYAMSFLLCLFIIGSILTPTFEEHLLVLIAILVVKPIAYLATSNWCPLSSKATSGFPSSVHLPE